MSAEAAFAGARGAGRAALLRRAMFIAGLAVSLLMVLRSSVGGDQLDLLARGWRLAAHGDLVPHGNPLSNGGNEPGALTSLVVGLPLFVRMDHRAPVALVWLTHLLAYLLLDRVLRHAATPYTRLLFCLFYWLNPWQLFFAGMLWNPSYLFLCGAVHLWSSWAQRERASFWASLALGLTIGAAAQLHPSALILILASALLLWRGYTRIQWPGLLLGGAIASVTLIPWWLAVQADPALLPGGKGFPFRGLVLVFPMLRGVFYWFRYGSFLVMERMTRPDFSALVGARVDAVLSPAVDGLRLVAGAAGLLLTSWVSILFLRRHVRWGRATPRANAGVSPARSTGRRAWLWAYAQWTAVGALLTFAASPTTIMGWQALIAVHAAVLPIVLGLEALSRLPRWRRLPTAIAPYAALSVALLCSFALGSPDYRCGGRHTVNLALLADHPMFRNLQIDARCPFPVDPARGWWPDALPRPAGAPAVPVTPPASKDGQ